MAVAWRNLALLHAFAGAFESQLCPSTSGDWRLQPAAQFSWLSSCELRAEWLDENRNYAWLDPGACCGAPGGWTNSRITAVVRATDMPSANKGRIELIARDRVGPSEQCSGNDPSEGYSFALDFAHGEASLERRAGCDTKRGLGAATAAALAVGASYTVTAELNGSSLAMFVDGALVSAGEDAAWAAGSVGVYCFRIGCALERLVVEPLGAEPTPPPTLPPTPPMTPLNSSDPGPLPTILGVTLTFASTAILIAVARALVRRRRRSSKHDGASSPPEAEMAPIATARAVPAGKGAPLNEDGAPLTEAIAVIACQEDVAVL